MASEQVRADEVGGRAKAEERREARKGVEVSLISSVSR
jgi:hypothetical protein